VRSFRIACFPFRVPLINERSAIGRQHADRRIEERREEEGGERIRRISLRIRDSKTRRSKTCCMSVAGCDNALQKMLTA